MIESLDGATTALQRRVEELTAELERSRYKGCGSYPRAIGEIESRLGIVGNPPLGEVVEAVRKLVTDLAAERTAREELDADWKRRHTEWLDKALVDAQWHRDQLQQAKRERDAALARVKEWEQAYDSNGFGPQNPSEVQVFLRERDRVNGQVAALRVSAAETALASARALLLQINECTSREDIRGVIRAWLTSHPAPVAAPSAYAIQEGWSDPEPEDTRAPVAALKDASACTGSSCDGCGASDCWETSSARTIIERLVRPYQHTSPPGFSTVIDDARAWLTSHPSPAPVAAPCAGCTSARTAITEALRLHAGGHEHGDVLRAALARVKELELWKERHKVDPAHVEALEARVKELEAECELKGQLASARELLKKCAGPTLVDSLTRAVTIEKWFEEHP